MRFGNSDVCGSNFLFHVSATFTGMVRNPGLQSVTDDGPAPSNASTTTCKGIDMVNLRRIAFGVVLSLVMTAGAWASNFRAADLVFMPAAARTAGNGGAFFKTDVYITNLTDQRVVVSMALVQGAAGNQTAPSSAVSIATLAPFERRNIVDVVKTVFNLDQGLGQLIFFACREGGSCTDCDTNSADCKLITVEGRIYTQAARRGMSRRRRELYVRPALLRDSLVQLRFVQFRSSLQ